MSRPVRQNHGYLRGVGRLRLHYRSWEVGRPTAGVLIVHGMFEHSGRYEELGEQLAAHGYSAFAFDMRGHGRSAGRRGHVRRFELLLQDLDRFRREVSGLVPVDLPLFLLGHSLGGLVSIRYIEEYDVPLQGAVLTSPWLGTTTPVPAWQSAAAAVLDRVLPAFPFPHQIDADELTHDPERAADYRDDPTIHSTITPRLFTEINTAMQTAAERADRIDLPLLMLLAGDDRIVDTDRSLAFARSLPDDDVTVEVIEGAYHEVLQERDRQWAIERVLAWLGAQLP